MINAIKKAKNKQKTSLYSKFHDSKMSSLKSMPLNLNNPKKIMPKMCIQKCVFNYLFFYLNPNKSQSRDFFTAFFLLFIWVLLGISSSQWFIGLSKGIKCTVECNSSLTSYNCNCHVWLHANTHKFQTKWFGSHFEWRIKYNTKKVQYNELIQCLQ